MTHVRMAARVGARLLAGPLALAAFFLPWGAGPGLFAANDFSGFALVAFTGRLQTLDLPIAGEGILLAVRLLVLGVAIAATWRMLLSVLAPAHRLHGWSGGYIVAATAVALAARIAISGADAPPVGLALLLASAALVLAEPAMGGAGRLLRTASHLRIPSRRAHPSLAES